MADPILIDKILVGYDFSEHSLTALEEALRVARLCDAEVTLVTVGWWNEGPKQGIVPQGSNHFDALLEQQPLEHRATFSALRHRYGEIAVHKMLVNSYPEEGVMLAGKAMEADLIVVGSHGRTGFRRFLLGSVSQKIVRMVEPHVMVVRSREDTGSYQRIFVPTDFSVTSNRAVEVALQLSSPDTAIDIAHFCYVPHTPPPTYWGTVPPMGSVDETIRKEMCRTSQMEGDRLLARHCDAKAQLSYLQFEEPPAQGIDRRLRDKNYDLVVMGSHGRRGLRRWLLGSVAEATVRHAKCSVIIVRASERS